MSVLHEGLGLAGASDRSLLRLLAGGDREAADEVYRRYADRLRRVVRNALSPRVSGRLDADDIVQSTFRRFLGAARDGRYVLPSGDELWGLLVVIGLNRVRSAEQYHRSGKRDVRQTVGLADGTAEPADDAALAVEVDEALAGLPPDHREVTRLRLAGYEVGEIAGRLGRSKRTVERVLQDTRGRLRRLLDAEAADDAADRRPD